MKKLFVVVIAILAMHTMQATDTYVGLKAGALFSKFTSRDASAKAFLKEDQKLFVGPTVGLNLFFRFNHYVALQPEFNFRMVGNNHKIDNDNSDVYRLMQVEIPIMVKGGYGTDKYFVYGSFGPYVAVNAAGQRIIKFAGTKNKEKIDFDKDNLQRVDVGLSAGVGGMYIMEKGALDVEFRYNIGLLGQFKDVSPKKENAFWSSFGINLAYVFKTGGK